MFPEWNSSPLRECTKMRRNDGTRQAHGSGKLYRKETNFPNSWMSMRKYAMISIRIFLPRVSSRMILLTGALRCLPKVYTFPRRSVDLRMNTGYATQYGFTDEHGFWEDEPNSSPRIHSGSALLDSMQLGNAQGYHLGGDMRMCRADGFSVQFEHLASHGG